MESSVDAAATARLFVGAGRSEGATPARLAALVKNLTGLPDKLIGSIEVYENFSFLTLPFEAAEKTIVEARKSGALPPVRFATPRGGREGGRPYEKHGGYEGKRSSYGEKRSYGKKAQEQRRRTEGATRRRSKASRGELKEAGRRGGAYPPLRPLFLSLRRLDFMLE